MIAADPAQGGATWAVLQYILGLRRLGYEAFLVEAISSEALRPTGAPLSNSFNARYFRRVTREFALEDCAALLLTGTRETVGLSYEHLRYVTQRTGALLNLSGMFTDDELLAPIPIRAYLDLDPAFNQLWQTVQGIDMRLRGHTHFVTIGLEIGKEGCLVPTCGKSWLKTLPPVVLSHWPVAERIVHNGLTTVGNWRGYGSIDYGGVKYGQKCHSFRPLSALPTMTDEKFLLALAIHPDETKDLATLRANGWQLLDPSCVADTPRHYRQFIQGSKAEFGLTKSGYVASRCGWLSDRSVCYLASGRPVIAQETGFSHTLPTGEGLFAFQTSEDVLKAIEVLKRDYSSHARHARALAEEYFDSDTILPKLLTSLGV